MAKINAKWAERHNHALAPRRRGPDVLLLAPEAPTELWTALEAAGIDVRPGWSTILCEACDEPTHNEDACTFDDSSWYCGSCYDYRACHGRDGQPCEGGYNGGPAEADDEGGHACSGCAYLKIGDVDEYACPSQGEVARHLGVCEGWARRIGNRLPAPLGRHLAALYRAAADVGFDRAHNGREGLDADEVAAVRDFIRALADGYPSEAGFAPDAYRALGWDEEPAPAIDPEPIDWQPCAQPSVDNDGGDAARAAFWGEEA